MDTAKYKDGIAKMTTEVQNLTKHASQLDFSIPRPAHAAYGMKEQDAKPVALKVILLILLVIALTVAGLTYWLV